MTDPHPQARTLAEALEIAVDAMHFYMLPSAMDGGIGECAALTNTKHAIEVAVAALASHPPAEPEWVSAITEACLHYDMTQAEAQSVVARARRRCAERSSAPFNSAADSSSERGDAFTGERASGEEGVT